MTIPAPAIGPRLKEERKARAMTLTDLASASNVSRSMLSQIERGEANPTFATLWSLTQALGLKLEDLTHVGAPILPISAIKIAPAHFTPEIRSEDGLCTLRILSPAESVGALEWYDIQMNPGGALISNAHRHGACEHLTALDGDFEIEVNQIVETVSPGATARYPADVPHSIRNRGARAARAVLVVRF